MDIFNYVKTFGHHPFSEQEFNEVDNLVLACLSYLDFTRIVPSNKNSITIKQAAKEYFSTHDKKSVYRIGFAQKDAYKLLKLASTSIRYQDILISHYRYISSLDSQFSAMTFKITKKLKYIAFEGTDELLSGWKEDAYMAFKFPVDAQKYAIDYLNEVVSLLDSNIILGGHSKGGNLALVAGMYANIFIRPKIKAIYSNDGPGLRKEEFYSPKYERIKKHYTHIIPSYSLIGTLLYNDHYHIVASIHKNILAHAASSWVIEDNHFKTSKQHYKSAAIEEKLNNYIDTISYEDQEQVVKELFSELEHEGINTIPDLFKLKTILKVIKRINNINPKTKKMLIEILEIIISSYI